MPKTMAQRPYLVGFLGPDSSCLDSNSAQNNSPHPKIIAAVSGPVFGMLWRSRAALLRWVCDLILSILLFLLYTYTILTSSLGLQVSCSTAAGSRDQAGISGYMIPPEYKDIRFKVAMHNVTATQEKDTMRCLPWQLCKSILKSLPQLSLTLGAFIWPAGFGNMIRYSRGVPRNYARLPNQITQRLHLRRV